MRFSMKTEYGFRAILELAGNTGRGALQSAEIARRQGIPGPFLDQVIDCLEGNGRDARPEATQNGDSQVLAQVGEKAEQAAREVFAAHTLADCLRLRRLQPRVFHGIFHSTPAKPRSG